MNDPFVSIIMRSYNEAWALKETLPALAAQEFRNWELIVIDSGSTDGSQALIRAAQPAHFVQITPSEYNPSRVMNHGMRLAKSEFGIFLNADLPAHLAMAKNATTGAQELSVKIDATKLNLMMEIIDITKDFADAKGAFEDILKTQIDAQLAKGIPGLDNIVVPLPAIDLGSLIPGLGTGLKMQLTLKDMVRAGGYTAIDAQIN